MAFHLKRWLIGNPLTSDAAHGEKLLKWKALAVLSSDALSSVAYATEEILIPLTLISMSAALWSVPIAVTITALIVILTISYRQTIDAYPGGGGAYTVSKENLGVNAGLVAGASLLVDYILTVAVSVASGVANIASAIPFFGEHKEILAVLIIVIMTIFNLRGVRESANIFALPTYFFIISTFCLLGVGFFNLATGADIPKNDLIHEMYPELPLFLLLRAFSSGCSALTGIEAISNGIPVFKDPQQKNAKITMAWMSFLLGVFFLGITALAHMYGIVPHENETVISSLGRAVFGDSLFYYFVPASTALILVLAANTSYADFPRLSSLLANDRFLPRQMASLGDRLVFSNGIMGLSLAAILLIILFRGETHLLIPLYAIGVFLSFTLSQAGMVRHHLRTRHPGWFKSTLFNTVGAITTSVVLIVIGVTKFMSGAWIVIFLIPLLVILFRRIRRHYVLTAKKLSARVSDNRPVIERKFKHVAIVPISGVHQGVLDAFNYAKSISKEVRACYVDIDPQATQRMTQDWNKKFPEIKIEVLPSPYRSVLRPILDYIDKVEQSVEADFITVIIPEFITSRWYHKFLHNQTAIILYAALRAKKNIFVTSVRYHLN